MASFLNLERYAEPGAPEVSKAPEPARAPADAAHTEALSQEEFAEFEIVVGRRQIAGAGLVAIVLLAVFSGVSYLIGKSMGPTAAAAATSAPMAQTPAVQVPVTQTAPPASGPAPGAIAAMEHTATSATTTAPVFAAAIPGKVYLQVGAIEKGLGGIWAEGLRTHGLDAFVAPGPSDKEWRVLIGPLPDPKAFQRAKDTLDRLGVLTFGRRYLP
jgi:cell division septation protein DedD